MWPFRRHARKIRQALRNKNLQLALERAASHHQRQSEKIERVLPLEELKSKAKAIREDCLARLPELLQEFTARATEAGAQVYFAATPEEALAYVEKIIQTHKAKLVLKAKSMVSEEVNLNSFLASRGVKVVETDLGEWVVQLAGERPSHITAPALHKTKEEMAKLLSQHLGRNIPPDPQEITRAAREYMRPLFMQAEIGITGANLAIAESGTLVILSNEGNARLVSSLPPVHIAIITVEKLVATMEQAVTLLKALVAASSGRRLTSYVSFITGPSSTTDIEKEHVVGAHGPREVHIIILDNGRRALADDPNLKEILACLKCGGCMLVCPVFQAVGGHVFGGPVYPGGIGLLLTFMTRSAEEIAPLLSLCADCKKCETFCPVGIHTGELIARLKTELGPSPLEKIISFFMQSRKAQNLAIPLAQAGQRLSPEKIGLLSIAFGWLKGKSLPPLRFRPPKKQSQTGEQARGKKRPRVYLFEGCLTRWFFPEIRDRVMEWLNEAGYQPVCPDNQACCGAPSYHLGDKQGVARLASQNLASFCQENPDFILTLCPTGQHLLAKVYPEINPASSIWGARSLDFVTFLEKNNVPFSPWPILKGKKIFYHPPCHLLANGLRIEDRVHFLEKIAGEVQVEKNRPTCCGFCGVFSFKHPEIANHLWSKKKEKILSSESQLVVTECPGCLLQFRAGLEGAKPSVQAYHLAELISFSPREEKRLLA